jgi:hypothetical protein
VIHMYTARPIKGPWEEWHQAQTVQSQEGVHGAR